MDRQFAAAVVACIDRKADYVRSNAATLSGKAFRAQLEAEMDLAPRTLAPMKKAIDARLLQIIQKRSSSVARSEAPKKAKPAAAQPLLRLKRLAAAAGLRLPPRAHAALKAAAEGGDSEVAVIAAYTALLESAGLSPTSSLAAAAAAGEKRALRAEMEGIDAGNIVAAEGRPRRALDPWGAVSTAAATACDINDSRPDSSPSHGGDGRDSGAVSGDENGGGDNGGVGGDSTQEKAAAPVATPAPTPTPPVSPVPPVPAPPAPAPAPAAKPKRRLQIDDDDE